MDVLNAILANQAELDADKEKERDAVLDYLRATVRVFGFSASDLFDVDTKPKLSKGALQYCRELFKSNPDVERKHFIDQAAADGVNPRTASTQFSRLKKSHRDQVQS